jgi:hypothetical protein
MFSYESEIPGGADMEHHNKTQGLPLTFRILFGITVVIVFFSLLLWDDLAHGSSWLPLVCLGIPMLGFAVVLGMDLAKWVASPKAPREAGQEEIPTPPGRA